MEDSEELVASEEVEEDLEVVKPPRTEIEDLVAVSPLAAEGLGAKEEEHLMERELGEETPILLKDLEEGLNGSSIQYMSRRNKLILNLKQ